MSNILSGFIFLFVLTHLSFVNRFCLKNLQFLHHSNKPWWISEQVSLQWLHFDNARRVNRLAVPSQVVSLRLPNHRASSVTFPIALVYKTLSIVYRGALIRQPNHINSLSERNQTRKSMEFGPGQMSHFTFNLALLREVMDKSARWD